jgi:hypothetical protein
MFQSSAFDPEQPDFNPAQFERAAQHAVVELQRIVGGSRSVRSACAGARIRLPHAR